MTADFRNPDGGDDLAAVSIPVDENDLDATADQLDMLRAKHQQALHDAQARPLVTQERASVGRDVHYVSAGSRDGTYPSTCRAAKITEVDGDVVSLTVFNPEGLHFLKNVEHDAERRPMTWHWYWED